MANVMVLHLKKEKEKWGPMHLCIPIIYINSLGRSVCDGASEFWMKVGQHERAGHGRKAGRGIHTDSGHGQLR